MFIWKIRGNFRQKNQIKKKYFSYKKLSQEFFSSIECPEFYRMPGVLYNARSSIECPEFYKMPGVLYNARSSIQCPEFYIMPGDFYRMPGVL